MTFEQMRAVTLGLQPLSRLDSPREVVRQFTPTWFAATMGTGILAIALSQFQADAVWVVSSRRASSSRFC